MGIPQEETLKQAVTWRRLMEPKFTTLEADLIEAIAGCHRICLERVQLERALAAVTDARYTLQGNIKLGERRMAAAS